MTGGKCQFLHIWALDTRSLLRVIEMPSKVRAVKQIHFLPESFDGGASQVNNFYFVIIIFFLNVVLWIFGAISKVELYTEF